MVVIRVYKTVVSPLLPHSCRFHPTCSTYALEALGSHGLLRGGWLSLKRVVRCHPYGKGGVDPVPSLKEHEGENG